MRNRKRYDAMRGPKYEPDEDADILATLAPPAVRMAALAERTGRTPAALRKRYQRLVGSQAAARAARKAAALTRAPVLMQKPL